MVKRKRIGLLPLIFIAFFVAIFAGIVFGSNIKVVQPLGDLFLHLIKFIIVPLIFSTLVVGVASTGDLKKLGRMGGKTIIYYLATTVIAVIIGLLAGALFAPGVGLDLSSISSGKTPEPQQTGGIVDILLNIVPEDPFKALTEANVLQIIFFAIFVGLGITMVGEKAQPVLRFFDGFAEIMYKITGIVMKYAPIGIFGLLAPIVGEHGLSVLLPLIKVILAVAIGCIVHAIFTYSISAKMLGKISPVKFFKGVLPASVVAFSTQSSSGTLPVTIKRSEENLGVSKKVTSFVLPLGATINMDGTSLYIAVASLFVAQVYGVHLAIGQILMIVLIATLGSIGTAGVPGAGMVMLTFVFSAIGLPLHGIALIAGIDRILDMFRTATNVTGDASAALYVNNTEKIKEKNIDVESSPNESL